MNLYWLLSLACCIAVAQAYVGGKDFEERRRLAEEEVKNRGEYIAEFECKGKNQCRKVKTLLTKAVNEYCVADGEETVELEIHSTGKTIEFIVFVCNNPDILGLGDEGENDERYQETFSKFAGVDMYYEQNTLMHVTNNEIQDADIDDRTLSLLPSNRTLSGTDPAPRYWNLDRVDQTSLPLDKSKSESIDYDGYGVTIYVVDTGIYLNHGEFEGRGEYGGDFINELGNDDYNGHGSHCAGTAAGKTVGIAKKARVIGIKALGRSGFSTTIKVALGIKWAIDHAKGTGKPGVISLSIGGDKSKVLDDLVTLASEKNIVVIAAGNNGKNACKYSPSRAGGKAKNKGGPIVVGAVDLKDKRAGFSNFGRCVDLWAPGVDIYSAWKNDNDGIFRFLSGTSMATPAVSGVAALLLQKNDFNKAKAQKELFSLSARGQLKGLKKGSKNFLLQSPKDKVKGTRPPPTPYPTFAPLKFCVGSECTTAFEQSQFGPRLIHDAATGQLKVPATNMCNKVNNKPYNNKVLLIARNANGPSCSFFQKVINSQAAGAVAVIFYNSQGGPVTPIYSGDDAMNAKIPSGMISKKQGLKFAKMQGTVAQYGSF